MEDQDIARVERDEASQTIAWLRGEVERLRGEAEVWKTLYVKAVGGHA